jgi:hypothetical protein
MTGVHDARDSSRTRTGASSPAESTRNREHTASTLFPTQTVGTSVSGNSRTHSIQTPDNVGSACGDTGIWARMCQYVDSLHGGNVALRELVGQKGPDYARDNLRFALLEFWSMRASDEDVLKRESYWKDVLLSRKFGLNPQLKTSARPRTPAMRGEPSTFQTVVQHCPFEPAVSSRSRYFTPLRSRRHRHHRRNFRKRL